MGFQGFWLNDWRWPYLVRYNGGPYWSTSDMYPQRLLDPTNDGSAMCIDCCVDAPTGKFARQYKSCFPYKAFSDNMQNGGDLLAITDDGWIKAFATQDVDHGHLYYFVGPGLYQLDTGTPGGWVIAGPDLDNTWRSVVTSIQQAAPDPYTRLGSLSLAYTQYTLQDLDTPYLINGRNPGISRISCIVSEHYNGANPQQAVEMERFIYGQWRGLMRWEHWVQPNVPPAPQVFDRAPFFPFGYPSLTLNPALVLGDCRTWTNWTTGLSALPVQTVGWPASVILP